MNLMRPITLRDLYPDLWPIRGSVARPLRRLLPQPLRSIEDYERYLHQDLETLTVRDLLRERLRISTAIGQTVGDDGIPPWFDVRLEKLQHASMKGRKR